MITTNFTEFKNFNFIVKTPEEPKCQVVTKQILLLHREERDYREVLSEYNGSLFCSSSDNDFEEVLKLYNSPVSFDCIAIDRVDVNPFELTWLQEELLEEFEKRFTDDEFYGLYFI